MDENKNDDLTKMIPEMNDFAGNLRSASRQENILVAAQKAAAIQAKKQAEAQKKVGDAIANTISGLTTFSKNLQSSGASGDFSAVNKVIDVTTKVAGSLLSMIPVVGGALDGLVEGAGEVAKFMVGQFAKAYGNFERLSDTGVVTTFEDMKESAQSTGLNFDDTTKIFVKYSKELSSFGGAAALGRKRIDMIMSESKEVSRRYQRIGLSAEDFAESQIQYIAQLQRGNGIQGKTDKELKEGSIRYIDLIDTLAKTTGVSRKELKDQIDERQRNARYLAGVANLGEKQQAEITKVLGQFNAADPELAEGLQDLIAADGRVMTEKAKATYLSLSRGGMDVRAEIAKLRGSGADAADFMNKATHSAAASAKGLKELTTYVGSDTLSTRNYVGLENLAMKKGMKFEEVQRQIDAARERSLAQDGGQNSDLANTRRSLYSSGQMLEQLATNSGLVTSVMSTMAQGMDKLTSTIYAAIGEDLPPYLKLRKEENDSIKKTAKLQTSRTEVADNLARLKEKMLEEVENPNSARAKSLRRKQERAIENMESELQLLQVQIIEQELETEELKKKRVTAENTSQGAGHPPAQQSSSPGGSGHPAGTGATSGANGAPPSSGSTPPKNDSPGPGTAPNQSAPGLGARQSEIDQVNRMDSGGKQGIGAIRELIASVESVGGSYNSLFGGSTSTPLTTMTITQVLEHQANMLKRGMKSTAAGKYQFMSYTLPEYARKAKFDFKTTLFNESTQDALADILIREKGYDKYKSGQITDRQFLANLSKAWAGLPNPEKGGKSNYAGDGLNAAHLPVQRALAKIGQARTGGIFSGPSTGYLAVLHGNEAVIPTNDGMSKQQFQDSLGGDGTADVAKMFEMMSKKINSMISIANDGVGIQKKAKKANVTMA
jgi:muramidase (phage lysozyme)